LLEEVEVLRLRGDPAATEITSVTQSSTAVSPGALFCCVRGEHADGHDFAGRAVASGATALLVERELALEVPQAVVRDTRASVGPLAAAFFGHPSRRLATVGVTGTNGKTTTTHLVKAVLEAAGRPTGIIGTLSGARTTPEATELQSKLAAMAGAGCVAAAVEVSSHALVQRRVDGTHFAVAVFTNLTPEHLDFHQTMEDYFAAKASLFEPDRADVAVINEDDAWGRRLLDSVAIPAHAFSLADVEDLVLGATSSTFRWEGHAVELRMGGRFNVANAVAAATVGRVINMDPTAIARGLSAAPAVPGRFEVVDAGQPFLAVVDFAHTPASLENALAAARQAVAPAGGKVICVFGCGGERDRAKRPLMGRVATDLADVAVLTSDNPRHENPNRIVDEVMAGVGRADVLTVEPDRSKAIARAIEAARPGDVVLIAGKGHETTQLVGDDVLPFDDREVTRRLLENREW
jgi:UDP-N-acetylmuramoyl-L-alanyl-D-glutamate--2,6-diaminopimelate ligase